MADKGNKNRRLFLPSKHNLTKNASGLAFTIESHGANNAPVVCWEPEPVNITADEALEVEHCRPGPSAAEREEAKQFLRETLAKGSLRKQDVIGQATDSGLKCRTVERAFAELGGLFERQGFGGAVVWSLPILANGSRREELGEIGKTWRDYKNTDENATNVTRDNCCSASLAKFSSRTDEPGMNSYNAEEKP